MVPFSFAGQEMRLVRARALFWPAENALLVADLHLEKG
ncbi:MAG TPA: phosphoesterase, partial [Novosphingobium sp.]|nr:phosphoesterase [Novosphingobium sp.]